MDGATFDLAAAVWQCLDDMGEDGKCVCGLAKARLRVAFEPFVNHPDWVEYPPSLSLAEAKRIIEASE